MQLSAKTYYGLKALADIAAHSEARSARHIAEAENIPLEFLEKILQRLRKNGLIISLRGKSGGYELARPARDITLANVFEELEGPLFDIPCLGGSCSHSNTCRTRDIWHEVNHTIDKTLSEITLEQITSPTINTPSP